jgi:hypothetical protein
MKITPFKITSLSHRTEGKDKEKELIILKSCDRRIIMRKKKESVVPGNDANESSLASCTCRVLHNL